ncbi:MAG: HAD family hydrolase [Candidatus Thorarchaeota archaeon]|jgi:HAD superfamily hydrolase (TIGR01549 family)
MANLKRLPRSVRIGGSRMLKAVLFDLDGTLTVLSLPLDAMRRDTKEYYKRQGAPADLFDYADGISSSRVKAREYFHSKGVSESEWTRMEGEVDITLSGHEGWAATDAKLIDGSIDVVRELKALGLKTAILTNNGRTAVDVILKNLPLQDLFDVIQTRNESPSPKPFPDGLNQLVNRIGLKSNEVVYIGDARIDGAAATRAGVEFWGVTTGETPRDELIKAGASHVFDSLQQILDIVKSRLAE